MKMYLFYILMLCSLFSCKEKKLPEKSKQIPGVTQIKYTVLEDESWSDVFVHNKGWFGGDGIFCLNKDGAETFDDTNPEILVWFSDSMFGDIVNGALQPGFSMINNSVALLSKNVPDNTAINFYSAFDAKSNPRSVFIPNTPDTQTGEYYWFGDGFVNQIKNNDIYLFGYRIKNIGQGTFGFKETGNNLVIIPYGATPPFQSYRQIDIPFFRGMNIDSVGSFGASVLVNTSAAGVKNGDGYIYIYGVRGTNKQLIVARVLPADIENFNNWAFWNGSAFTNNTAAIKPITDQTSNELNISVLPDGKYILVYQAGLNGKIYFRIGASPVGPFEDAKEIYDPAAKYRSQPNIFTYNAKAHPVLSRPGELLISYNVNSFNFFQDLKADPHLYRPRFVRMIYELK